MCWEAAEQLSNSSLSLLCMMKVMDWYIGIEQLKFVTVLWHSFLLPILIWTDIAHVGLLICVEFVSIQIDNILVTPSGSAVEVENACDC